MLDCLGSDLLICTSCLQIASKYLQTCLSVGAGDWSEMTKAYMSSGKLQPSVKTYSSLVTEKSYLFVSHNWKQDGYSNFNTNKIHWCGGEARWKLQKNAACCHRQILEATPHKTASVWPPSSHLTNHSRKMNKTCEIQLEKKGQINKRCSLTDSCTWVCQCWPTSKDLLISSL